MADTFRKESSSPLYLACLTERLLQEFDPSTGKLTTMASSIYGTAADQVTCDCYHVIANSLESLGQLDKPIGQLALAIKMRLLLLDQGATIRNAIAIYSTAEQKMPACLIVTFNGNHEGASKYAQFITESPDDTCTVVAVQLGLPGRLDSERKLQRLAQKSFVSVFTMVDGAVETVVQQEPLSTPGGGVKMWLSDLVKERENLPGEFVRPLGVRYVLLLFSLSSSSSFTVAKVYPDVSNFFLFQGQPPA